MFGVPREVIYDTPNVVADKFDLVPLDENCYMMSFYFGEERITVRIFASRVELEETRDLINDTLDLEI